MKKIEVNNKCNGCGLCIMNCTYLEEDDEGNACPVLGMIVNDKYKDKWYFGNFLSVAREFVDTIKWAVDCKSYDIEESAEQSVNYVLEKFEDKFHDMLEEKIKELKKYVKDNS